MVIKDCTELSKISFLFIKLIAQSHIICLHVNKLRLTASVFWLPCSHLVYKLTEHHPHDLAWAFCSLQEVTQPFSVLQFADKVYHLNTNIDNKKTIRTLKVNTQNILYLFSDVPFLEIQEEFLNISLGCKFRFKILSFRPSFITIIIIFCLLRPGGLQRPTAIITTQNNVLIIYKN